jgi:DhnA family fructose-bisphosphate aldolase class Ia
VVALDHGQFGVAADLRGIESIDDVLDTVSSAGPDGILMASGQAGKLSSVDGPVPSLVVRGDVTNLYLGPPAPSDDLADDIVERAVRHDAAAVLLNLLDAEDDPNIRAQCLRNVYRAKAACERFGMPLMVEPIPFIRTADGYRDVADPERLIPMVRQAVEVGADIIKAGILAETDDMRRAIRVAGGRPYLARGGSKIGDVEALTLTRHLLDCGASGIVFGRNIFHHDQPAAMTAAFKRLIHDDASVEDARRSIG